MGNQSTLFQKIEERKNTDAREAPPREQILGIGSVGNWKTRMMPNSPNRKTNCLMIGVLGIPLVRLKRRSLYLGEGLNHLRDELAHLRRGRKIEERRGRA